MRKLTNSMGLVLLVTTGMAAGACGSVNRTSVMSLGLQESSGISPNRLVWIGTGEVWRFEQSRWRRTPEQDYQFLVRQFRYGNHWESLKVMNRKHPGYDGIAGDADQQHLFVLDYSRPGPGSKVVVGVKSTLGPGSGTTDPEFRNVVFEFDAEGVSSFAPFNRYRITQHYDYENGRLTETVELFMRLDSGEERQWVKVEEKADIFVPSKLKAPPSMFSAG